MMHEYLTVRPTGMLLREKKRIVFVSLCNFPGIRLRVTQIP